VLPLQLWLVLVTAPAQLRVEYGFATGYNPWRLQYGRVGKRIVRFSSGRPYCNIFRFNLSPSDKILAHRTWPCSTKVLVLNPRSGRRTWAVVGDRGPYGAVGPKKKNGLFCRASGREIGWCVKRPKRRDGSEDPGRWRGVADLSPSLRKEVLHSGHAPIFLITTALEINKARHQYRSRSRRLRSRSLSITKNKGGSCLK